jgi:hypothetical protein
MEEEGMNQRFIWFAEYRDKKYREDIDANIFSQ